MTVASNGSRFVHGSNVFIARPLYRGIVISGRDDISCRATKKLDKNGSQLLVSPNTMISFVPASLTAEQNVEVNQIGDKSRYFFHLHKQASKETKSDQTFSPSIFRQGKEKES